MESKLFTTSAEDAVFFARTVLFPLDQKPLMIVEVEIPDGLAARCYRFITDGKPAVAVDLSLLSEFNAAARVQSLCIVPLVNL